MQLCVYFFHTNSLMCNLVFLTTICCTLLLSPCWHFLMKPWKWSPSTMQELIAYDLSPNKTMELKPVNDEGVHCRWSSLHYEKVQMISHVGEFMTVHSTSARKAISEVTSMSHIQYFCCKKQLNLLQDVKKGQANFLHHGPVSQFTTIEPQLLRFIFMLHE